MSEQLGRIERPQAERFRHRKKLYLVPLIYSGDDAPDEYKERHSRYWGQVAEQLHNLASKIGIVKRIYHESIYQVGEDGMKAVERLNPSSYLIAKTQCDHGAIFEPLEEKELLEDMMDWQRCLMLGFMSEKVGRRVFEFYHEAAKKRDEALARKIGETLKDDEAGVLFIREGHTVQFPPDIEVFSVFPPALDEIHRWQRDQAARVRQTIPEQRAATPQVDAEGAKRKTKRRTRNKPEN
jgi:hypothetical protein